MNFIAARSRSSLLQRAKIPTHAHGYIDYAVAGLFGALATSASLDPSVRRTLGIVGAAHAGYSAVTDYELGARKWLGMRQHLVLDTALAASLVVSGAMMRRAPASQRAILVAAALAELGIVAASRTEPSHAAVAVNPTTYAPLDTPKPVGDGIYIIDSELPGLIGKVLPIRMTVIQLPDGSLLLHSPTRLTERLRQALLRIGPVSHLVAPSFAHWTLLEPWQLAFPHATTWAAPGLRARRQVRQSGIRLDYDLPRQAPPAWGNVIEIIMVEGGLGFHEAVLFHRPSRTLVLTDLVLNLESEKLPVWARPVLRLFGSTAPDAMPPPYLRFTVKMKRGVAKAAVTRMLALGAERAVFAHGAPFEHDATHRLRRSFRWLLS